MKRISTIFQILLWCATAIFTIIWLFDKTPFIDPEPITVALGMVAFANTTVLSMYSNALNEETFSISNTLAIEYVNNFIEPILTQIIKNSKTAQSKIKLYILIPDTLNDLKPRSIDRSKAILKGKNLIEKTQTVKLDAGRGNRDIMTVKNIDGETIYFDFPNTLLTIQTTIDYKVGAKKDSFNEKEKNKLTAQYIDAFKQTVQKQLTEYKLYPDYVEFTNSLQKIEL